MTIDMEQREVISNILMKQLYTIYYIIYKRHRPKTPQEHIRHPVCNEFRVGEGQIPHVNLIAQHFRVYQK